MARQKTQINRREDILDAAQILFSQKGFEKTTIDEIAQASGIAKGSVYLDFRNKEEILTAIIEQKSLNRIKRLEAQVNAAIPPYLDILKTLIQEHLLEVFDDAFSKVKTHFALLNSSIYIKKNLQYICQNGQSIMARLLEKANENKEISQFYDYKYLAQIIDFSLQAYLPPYDLKFSLDQIAFMSKEEIRNLLAKDLALSVEIILAGLKNTKFEELKKVNK